MFTDSIPSDPVILLSYINTFLRDYYPTLDSLCEDRQISKTFLIEELSEIDYVYDTGRNQFI